MYVYAYVYVHVYVYEYVYEYVYKYETAQRAVLRFNVLNPKSRFHNGCGCGCCCNCGRGCAPSCVDGAQTSCGARPCVAALGAWLRLRPRCVAALPRARLQLRLRDTCGPPPKRAARL